MSASFAKFISYLMLVFYTVIPTFFTSQYKIYKPDNGVDTKVALISDTHIDAKELLIQNNLKMGFRNMGRMDEFDALVVDGDLTNYGDEKSLELFYDIAEKYRPAEKLIVSYGNHDIGHSRELGLTSDDARAYDLKHYNAFSGTNYDKIYYSTEVNGYKFITLADEGNIGMNVQFQMHSLLSLTVSLKKEQRTVNLFSFAVTGLWMVKTVKIS